MRLANKVALITGAGRGIGKAIALAFAREGAKVVVTSRTQAELDSVVNQVKELGSEGTAVVGDASKEADVEKVVNTALRTYGQIDILVNNVGMAYYKPLVETSVEEYDTMMNTNMRSTFLYTRYVVPHMIERRQGTIIIVSSMAGVRGFANEAVYCATKHAQMGFATALDKELRPYNIKVGTLNPGGVNTTFAIGTGRTAGDPKIAMMLDPETVAEAAVLMATAPEKARIMQIWMRPMSEAFE
ncbi:MAG: short-chain dehydrogenase [Bacillota bacterium]|nr:MAG: short-chain dehydrogenase [Bacillota bacterium]